jgi:hypothetical protein
VQNTAHAEYHPAPLVALTHAAPIYRHKHKHRHIHIQLRWGHYELPNTLLIQLCIMSVYDRLIDE